MTFSKTDAVKFRLRADKVAFSRNRSATETGRTWRPNANALAGERITLVRGRQPMMGADKLLVAARNVVSCGGKSLLENAKSNVSPRKGQAPAGDSLTSGGHSHATLSPSRARQVREPLLGHRLPGERRAMGTLGNSSRRAGTDRGSFSGRASANARARGDMVLNGGCVTGACLVRGSSLRLELDKRRSRSVSVFRHVSRRWGADM